MDAVSGAHHQFESLSSLPRLDQKGRKNRNDKDGPKRAENV